MDHSITPVTADAQGTLIRPQSRTRRHKRYAGGGTGRESNKWRCGQGNGEKESGTAPKAKRKKEDRATSSINRSYSHSHADSSVRRAACGHSGRHFVVVSATSALSPRRFCITDIRNEVPKHLRRAYRARLERRHECRWED